MQVKLVKCIQKAITKIRSGIETNDASNELFNTFRKRYQEGSETKIKGSSFTFECVNLLEYHLHKIGLNRGSSYIESPDWIKNKRATINPKILKIITPFNMQ